MKLKKIKEKRSKSKSQNQPVGKNFYLTVFSLIKAGKNPTSICRIC